jgi:uncharacterized protein YjbI with pentapeptide repeats
LSLTNAEGAQLKKCVLIKADCTESLWTAALLDSCDLSHAVLNGAQMSNCTLTTVNLHAIHEKNCHWHGAKLAGVLRTDPALLRAELWQAST